MTGQEEAGAKVIDFWVPCLCPGTRDKTKAPTAPEVLAIMPALGPAS